MVDSKVSEYEQQGLMSHKSFLDYLNIVNFNEEDPENYFVHEKTLSQKHERYVYLVKNKNDG